MCFTLCCLWQSIQDARKEVCMLPLVSNTVFQDIQLVHMTRLMYAGSLLVTFAVHQESVIHWLITEYFGMS